jgi:hypothetical protein
MLDKRNTEVETGTARYPKSLKGYNATTFIDEQVAEIILVGLLGECALVEQAELSRFFTIVGLVNGLDALERKRSGG